MIRSGSSSGRIASSSAHWPTFGLALVRAVRARGLRTPVVALTAHAGAKMRVQALMAGFNTYIAKPVEPAELSAVVVQLAEQAQFRQD
jgi:DNA-binding response OmpR family regulator